ncbi:hypothetical protein [Streptomyces buecherae]|uniref:hypothetical protein n=1 Tax=Streptomyces buecherae TaxID=2763006 RepID=UPI0036907F2C
MDGAGVRTLASLVRCEGGNVASLVEQARVVSGGLIDEVVYLTRADAVDVLTKFLAGRLSADDFSDWAEAVHGLDTIGIEEDFDDLLIQFLFEISTPELFWEVNGDVGRRWLDRMRRSM